MPQSKDAAVALDATPAVADDPVVAEAELVTSLSGAEVIGRALPPMTRRGGPQPVAVLVGAASVGGADAADDRAAAAGARLDRGAAPRDVDSEGDTPAWSFSPGLGRSDTTRSTAAREQTELPLETTPAAIVSAPRPQPHFGPVGRSRSAFLVPVFAALTLGVSALVWHRAINRELEEFDPKLHARPVRSAVALVLPWLIGLLATLGGAALIVAGRLAVHLPFSSHVSTLQAYLLLAGLAVVPYLVLIFPVSLIAVVMTLERLRCVEEHVGTTTDRQVRPVAGALLLAIPIGGGLALLAIEQRRLNAIWAAVEPVWRGSH